MNAGLRGPLAELAKDRKSLREYWNAGQDDFLRWATEDWSIGKQRPDDVRDFMESDSDRRDYLMNQGGTTEDQAFYTRLREQHSLSKNRRSGEINRQRQAVINQPNQVGEAIQTLLRYWGYDDEIEVDEKGGRISVTKPRVTEAEVEMARNILRNRS